MRTIGAAIFVCSLVLGTNSFGEDFQKTYTLAPGGHIRISNASGNIKISGYDGETVLASGVKQGRDRDRIQVEETSAGDSIELKVAYPHDVNCDASINFDIRVPKSVSYNFDRISSVTGNVEIAGVTGQVRTDSISGNVDLKDIDGLVSAASVSGNVNAEIRRPKGSGDMKFSSVSGNVIVRAPSDLDADIEMSSVTGSLKSDFAIDVQEHRYGPGQSARGRLGSGARSLRLMTVSGRVNLVRS